MGRNDGPTPQKYLATVTVNGERVRRQRTKLGKLGWQLRYRDPRSREYQPSTTFWGTEVQAQRALDKLVADAAAAAAPVAIKSKSTTLAEWVDEWLDSYSFAVKPTRDGSAPGVLRPRATQKKAEDMCDTYLLPKLGDRKLRTITHDDLYETIAGLRKLDKDGKRTGDPLTAATKNTVAGVARSLFRDAVRAGYLGASPAALLPTVWDKEPTRRAALIPSISEVEKLASALDLLWPLPKWAADLYGPNGEGNGDLVRIIAYTALRIEELTALDVSAVNLTMKTIQVRDVATESGGRREYRQDDAKSAASKRPLIIFEQAEAAIGRRDAVRLRGLELEAGRDARRQARRKASTTDKKRAPNRDLADRWTLLCPGEQGGFMSYAVWRKHLAAARQLSGVDLTAHELRHVCVSIMYAAGMSDEQIQRQIGHKIGSSLTRQVYQHLFLVNYRIIAKRVSKKIAVLTAAEAARGEYVEESDEER
ncbi:tyrosine-type recombinase/integrase [uncultured Friedmanniella sp.]|uniref:tyrosine-type recombinase/integrase n=1 Tax=uncultured Friedmanniella sp. TaxID=335381 RepID=UPI0035CB0C0C